jgi:hypothetical protein
MLKLYETNIVVSQLKDRGTPIPCSSLIEQTGSFARFVDGMNVTLHQGSVSGCNVHVDCASRTSRFG